MSDYYILDNFNNGKVTAAIFLDLKKAFDTVDHELLIDKLKSYGINNAELKWFVSYLSERSQVVHINATQSDPMNINIGIPQGSILGPLLFIIHVNSLPDIMPCKCVMYADDTTILCNSSDPVTLQYELDSYLSKISNWFNKNKLTLNIKKTKLMVFGTSQILSKFKDISISYNGDTIERVDSFKYLGVTFDPQLTWKDHINRMSSNVSKRIGVIRRIKYFLPPNTLKMLATALVIPLFDYCCCVWSNCNIQYSSCLQVLMNRLGRILLSVDIKTSVDFILSSLGWRRLNVRWNEQLLIMTFKCLKGCAPTYLSSKFIFNNSLHSKCTRSQTHNNLIIPPWNICQGKRTFLYRSSKGWNDLPNEIKTNFKDMTIFSFQNTINL